MNASTTATPTLAVFVRISGLPCSIRQRSPFIELSRATRGNFGYTAVGEQVGMAQRMESVAPPGGVMLGRRSEMSTVEELLDRAIVGHGGSGRRGGATRHWQEPFGA
jgi:hypothetical protein